MNSALSCCRKQTKKLSNNKSMLLETGLFLKMQSDCLPAGGAVRAAELAVSPVTQLRSWTRLYQIKWKCNRNFSEDSRFPSEIHSYKTPAARFDFETCSAHVYLTKSNATNIYWNIGNVFKNHITVIEKNYITIHIDTELLSSPKFFI